MMQLPGIPCHIKISITDKLGRGEAEGGRLKNVVA
jgi:hypothetical protein